MSGKVLFVYFLSRPIVNSAPRSWTSVRSREATGGVPRRAAGDSGKADSNSMYVSNGRYPRDGCLVQEGLSLKLYVQPDVRREFMAYTNIAIEDDDDDGDDDTGGVEGEGGGLERRSRNGKTEWWEKMVGEPAELKCACE